LVRAVALDQLDAKCAQLVAHRRIDIRVATGDAKSGLLRDGRDAAHEGAANAKNMEMHCECCRTGEGGDCTRALRYDRPHGFACMSRNGARQNGMRARIAAAAARLMAEDGINDFALAKRKAARGLGASNTEALPGNDEIEAELRAYLALYQADEHPERLAELRKLALEAMCALERFTPYLTGPILAGTAGHYAEIELQLFPESTKEVELFLIDRNLPYEASDERRYSGDRARAVAVISLAWQGVPLRLSVFDPRDERSALKTTLAGRVTVRAGMAEVRAMVDNGPGETADEARSA